MPLGPCTIYPPALTELASFNPNVEEMLNTLKESFTDFVFGFETHFKESEHGRVMNERHFEDGSMQCCLTAANLRYMGNYFTLALTHKEDGKEECVASLIVVYTLCQTFGAPTFFVSSINATDEYASFLFDVLECLIQFLWTTSEDQYKYEPLRAFDYVEIAVHQSLLPVECANDLWATGFFKRDYFERDAHMLLKGVKCEK